MGNNKEWDIKKKFNTNEKYVTIIVRIRNNKTKEIREIDYNIYFDEEKQEPFIWTFTDGNWACDCNRSDKFHNKDMKSDCGEGRYSIQLINKYNGKVFYDEFDC